MKYKWTFIIISFSILILVTSCGGMTSQSDGVSGRAASGSVISGSAVSGNAISGSAVSGSGVSDSIKAEQVKLLVEKKDKWLQTDERSWCDYSVTDFDQNGRLEICRIESDEDMGYQNTFWEVNEQNDDLEEIQLDKAGRKDWLIDTDDGYGIGYYAPDSDTYHYVVPEAAWLEADDVDSYCLDMTKSEDRMDICRDTVDQKLLKTGKKFYYRIEWFGQEDEDSGEVTEELDQALLRSAKEFRIRYSDEMEKEIKNPYFPYHERKQTVKMQMLWRGYEGITGEMIYTIYKVAAGTEGTLYFIDDTDIKNVIDTKTGKKKPQSWWGGRLDDRAREYLWVTKDEIYLVQDFNNVVNPGQNDFGKLLFDGRLHDTAVCICDKAGNSPELTLKRKHAWKKNVGWIGYRCYGEEWHNYKMQQQGYEPFGDE
ncbi:MAG: hypothetical protein NC293_00150 [Roseburia sp.]|nr:hypothetical protein [Roseburia sp.]